MKVLTANELDTMKQGKNAPLIINVLSNEDFQAAHIPGSINIPLQSSNFIAEVEQRAGGKSSPVVVYCGNASCDASPKAATKLRDAGFANVMDFEDGVEGWEKSGRKLEGTGHAATR